MLFFISLIILLTTLVVESCPSHCTCSVIRSALNCANGGFRRIPHGMASRYKKLNLVYNRIRNLSLEDIRRLDTFKSVDLTHNPLNCTDLYFVLRNRRFISTDCDYRILEHILTTYTQTKPTTARLNSTVYTTPNERTRNGQKSKSTSKRFIIIIIVIIVSGLIVVGALFYFVKCKSRHNRRVIQINAVELNTLRQCDGSDEEEKEITLFNSKEKQF